MRHILIITFIILMTSPLLGKSHKVENLFGWITASGVQLREFGDQETHPIYNGDSENGKPEECHPAMQAKALPPNKSVPKAKQSNIGAVIQPNNIII